MEIRFYRAEQRSHGQEGEYLLGMYDGDPLVGV
jgi:hypothetical protein